MILTFTSDGTDFSAINEARAWLWKHGYSVGVMQGPDPIGILKGDYDISKWRNMTREEIKALDGRVTGDKRNGPVTVHIYDAEHPAP